MTFEIIIPLKPGHVYIVFQIQHDSDSDSGDDGCRGILSTSDLCLFKTTRPNAPHSCTCDSVRQQPPV